MKENIDIYVECAIEMKQIACTLKCEKMLSNQRK